MVLEEIDRPPDANQDSAFSEALPTNDADPYADDHTPAGVDGRSPNLIPVNSPPHRIYVNLNHVPKVWSPFPVRQVYSDGLSRVVQETCSQASGILGRPVNQQEADALAFHMGRAIRISSYGAPLGMAVASVVAYRGWNTMRFPGWTAQGKINLDKFGPMKGKTARLAWQALRIKAYWVIGAIAGQIFMSSYALTSGSAGRLMDPRLKELSEVVRSRARSGVPTEGTGKRDHTAGPRNRETMDMAKQSRRAQEAQEAWQRRRQETTAGQAFSTASQNDDMIPTEGAFGAEYVDLGSADVSSTGLMIDDRARRSSEMLASEQRADYADKSEPSRSMPQARSSNTQNAPPSTKGSSAPRKGGSAWERLRQEAAQQQQSAAPNRGTSSTESFSFWSSDEDKQHARSEAQKDFDSRLEQERQGKDFDDRTSGGRW